MRVLGPSSSSKPADGTSVLLATFLPILDQRRSLRLCPFIPSVPGVAARLNSAGAEFEIRIFLPAGLQVKESTRDFLNVYGGGGRERLTCVTIDAIEEEKNLENTEDANIFSSY